MASEKLPYSFKLINNNTELLIEYIDDKYNTYKCLINRKDTIVSHFLNGDMCRLKNMLECNPQFEVEIDSLASAEVGFGDRVSAEHLPTHVVASRSRGLNWSTRRRCEERRAHGF